jgi:hypothetical protein
LHLKQHAPNDIFECLSLHSMHNIRLHIGLEEGLNPPIANDRGQIGEYEKGKRHNEKSLQYNIFLNSNKYCCFF